MIGRYMIDTMNMLDRCVELFSSIESVDLETLLQRLRSCRVVLLGEATHGTAEFYEMRAKITKALIRRHGFNCIAVEADWPDAAAIDRYIRGKDKKIEGKYFSRFPPPGCGETRKCRPLSIGCVGITTIVPRKKRLDSMALICIVCTLP